MGDGPALLHAILAAPADDAPRLIFADWLDEHGQSERAAHIRQAIRLLRPVIRIGPSLEFPDAPPGLQYKAQRGFSVEVVMRWADFEGPAVDWFQTQPITAVRLADKLPVLLRGRWTWLFTAEAPNGPHDLPLAIRPPPLGDMAAFGSLVEAEAAAGAWCVADGRRRAGLPPLRV